MWVLDLLNQGIYSARDWLFFSWWVWYPLLALWLASRLYLNYIRRRYISDLDWRLLEIKIPREVNKSPQAMEVVVSALHQTLDGNFLEWYLDGRVRSWFSLEMVSIGGKVRFFIRTQAFFSKLVKTQIYSQYPEIEIQEVEDYVNIDQPGGLWGVEFVLAKEDAYPIKTYIDYGLDRDPKEEFKIDPLTPVLELLGSIGPGEQMWVQILIRASTDRFKKKGAWFKKEGWKDQGKDLVKKLMKRDELKKLKDSSAAELTLSPGEKEIVASVERSLSKLGFDCGFRAIYLADEDKFNTGNIAGLIGTVKQFNSLHLNGFKIGLATGFKYKWQDPFGKRIIRLRQMFFNNYRHRAYFYPPYTGKLFVLNTEELATIYHFPGAVAATPTLGRIESKRGEPPPNLPR